VGKITSIGSGLPGYPWDAYSSSSKLLTVAAVTYGGKVYTNVTVSVSGIVSVGGGAGTAQTVTFPTPSFGAPQFQIGTWATLGATASSGLPVSYTSLTPAVCGVYTTTAQQKYIAFQYYAPYPAPFTEQGIAVVGATSPAAGVYIVNTLVGTATLVNGKVSNAPMGLLSQLTQYPASGPGYTAPYTNYVSGIWIYDDVFLLNGGAIFDPAGLAVQIPGDIINLGNYNGFYYLDQIEATAKTSSLNAGFTVLLPGIGTAVAGMSQGACTIAAFQAGNGTYQSALPATVTFGVGEIILP